MLMYLSLTHFMNYYIPFEAFNNIFLKYTVRHQQHGNRAHNILVFIFTKHFHEPILHTS